MTATLSGATDLEHLLGTISEAMTAEVLALHADTPADVLRVLASRIRHVRPAASRGSLVAPD